jgi:hypothetical protein
MATSSVEYCLKKQYVKYEQYHITIVDDRPGSLENSYLKFIPQFDLLFTISMTLDPVTLLVPRLRWVGRVRRHLITGYVHCISLPNAPFGSSNFSFALACLSTSC